MKKIVLLVEDKPEEMAKLVKDLGETEGESVNGQDCYTLTAKVQ